MTDFKKLFVAIDFSPASDEALREADQRARASGAQLAVCHVIPNKLRNSPLFPQDVRSAALHFPVEMKQIGGAARDRIAEVTGRTEGEYDFILDDGSPHAVILNQAAAWSADLIILGSHGQTSAHGVLLGSVSDSVIRHAHCPVLIVRPGPRTGCIVAGTDFSDSALPAVRAAADEATRTGAQLVVIHSLDLVWAALSYPAMAFGGGPLELSPDVIASLSTAGQEQLEQSLKQMDIQGETVVPTGAAGTTIVDIATERKAALIVVGTIGRTGLRRALLGSVAETVLKHAPCSVLVVRRHPE